MILYHKCKEHASKDLPRGLSKYPNLQILFEDAINSGLEISTENPILRNSVIDNDSSKAFLDRIDLALRSLDVKSWPRANKRSLMKRITSSVSTISFPIISELEVYLRLVAAVGRQNVSYQYVIDNKAPDYKIHTNNKDIIFELISLQERRPIEHIKNVFMAVGNKILTHIKKNNFYLRIDIDSGHLQSDINGKGRPIINEEKSIEALEDYLERIDLEKLIGSNCVLDFEARKNGIDFVKVFGEDTDQSQEIVHQWLQSHNSKTVAPASIHRITTARLEERECIELASVDFFSESNISGISGQEASSFQMPSFKDHLKRSVQEKISRGQREANEPCIIIIQTRLDIDWQYQYEIDCKEFQELKSVIVEELEKTDEISGIILFYSQLDNGRYIENMHAEKLIRVQRRDLENARILRAQNLPSSGGISYSSTWNCQVCGKPFPSYSSYFEHFELAHR